MDTCLPVGGERLVGIQKVVALYTIVIHVFALVAQWIERLVAVQKVAGSIPAEDTLNVSKKSRGSQVCPGILGAPGRMTGQFLPRTHDRRDLKRHPKVHLVAGKAEKNKKRAFLLVFLCIP